MLRRDDLLRATQAALAATGFHASGSVINSAFVRAARLAWPDTRTYEMADAQAFTERTIAAREIRNLDPSMMALVVAKIMGVDVSSDDLPRPKVLMCRIFTPVWRRR